MTIEEEWLFRGRGELQKRYGAGTFVAVYDWAVIEWGDSAAAVRERAEANVGDTVFVGAVPSEPPDDVPNAGGPQGLGIVSACLEVAGDKRRFRIPAIEGPQSFYAILRLDICGQKTEFVDGVVIIDGEERRYADHDYRLLVEHGIVPKETELIAGVIYWKTGQRPPDAKKLDRIHFSTAKTKDEKSNG